jgi:hypothetical protein
MAPRRTAKQPAATSTTAPLAPLPRLGAFAFAFAAVLICLAYSLYTNQTWEDSLITLRHSENLLNGEGLTYNPGTRVHGFTSPINVLLLTFCHLITGRSSYVATVWAYRVFSIPAFAASGVLLLKAFHETPPRWTVATWFLGCVYLFNVSTIAFSTNGMETAFMLLFVAWCVYLLSRANPDQWLARGLCWAGLMWSRPDGCIYIAAFSLSELIFLSASRRATFVSLLKSAAVSALAYGPWVIWAWLYYGSPIPHTIIAKANVEQGALAQLVGTLDNLIASLISIAGQVFRPMYYGDLIPDWWTSGIWARLISGLSKLVGIAALLYVFCPVRDRFGRAMSLSFLMLCFYLAYMPMPYPWYFPPAALLGTIAFTRAATALALTTNERLTAYLHLRQPRTIVLAMFVVLAVGSAIVFVAACQEQRVQQAEIEVGNRTVLGTWLKEHAKPTDTVYLEPLGYIGYFSGLHMNDFPGLVSPEVVQLRRQLPKDDFGAKAARYLVIGQLKPNWVVLRSLEYTNLARLPAMEQFTKDYTMAQEFNVEDRLRQYRFLPGRKSLQFDAHYGVFKRNR